MKRSKIKGLLHIAVLTLIKNQPIHGGEIQRKLSEKLNIIVDKPVIYLLLRKLENMDYLKSKWDTSENGPAKRVYTITPKGVKHLEAALKELSKVKSTIELIFSNQ